MIDAFAEKTAISLKEINPEKTASIEVMKYGLIVGINGFSTAFLSLLAGWAGGKLAETFFVLVSMAIFRFFSGGFHFQSAWACIVFSSALMIAIPHIHVNEGWTLILTAGSLLLTMLYAPSRVENETRIPKKYFSYLKFISVLIVSTNFLFLSPLLSLVLFSQSILLVKLRR